MKDERKTKKQLIEELNEVRKRVEQLGEISIEPAIRTLMNASSDAAILIEPNGMVVTVNTLIAERMGTSIDELEGKNIFDLIPPEAAETRKKLIRKVVRSGKAEHFVSVKFADKVLAVSIYPIINAKGRVAHLALFEHDITERVQAEEELKDSEERYRDIFETSPQGILTSNLLGKITSCNPAFLELTGFSEDEIVGKHFTKLPTLQKKNLAVYLEMYNNLMKGKIPDPFDFEWLHKDGTTRLADARLGPMKEEGHLIGVQVIIQDITERVQAEEELKDSEERYRNLFETSPQGILTTDLEGKITSCNSAFLELSGFSEDEIVGIHFTKLPTLQKEDMALYMELFDDMVKGKIPDPIDFEWLHKDGTTRLADALFGFVKEEGHLIGVQIIVQDITERVKAEEELKDSEERYRNLFEASPQGIIATDLLGKITSCNSSFLELTGFSEDEIVGKHFTKLPTLPKKNLAVYLELYDNLKKGKIPDNFDFEWLHKDGTTRLADAHFGPLKEQGRLIGVQIIVQDITERVQAEETLRERESQIQAVVESVPFDVFAIDKNGRYFLQNSFGRERWGDTIGKRPEDLDIDKEILEQWQENNQRAFAGETFRKEMSFGIKGEERHFTVQMAPIKRGKEIEGVVGIPIDITERVKAEEKLKESEERYRNLFESSPQGIVTMDLEGEVTSCNSAFLALSGYSEDEIVGKHFTKVPTLPAGNMTDYEKIYADLMVGKAPEPFEFSWLHKDGTTRLAEARIGFLKENGHLIGVQIIVEDITERVKAEEELKIAQFSVERTSDAVFWVGPDAHFIYVNDAACQAMGYTKDELLTMTVHDFNPELSAEVWPEHWRELKEKGSMMIQALQQAKDGSVCPYEININYFEYQGQEYNFSFARDITERKKAEEELRESEEKYRLVVENSLEGIAVVQDGLFCFTNPGVEKLLVYSEEELINKPFIEIVHPDDREIIVDRYQRRLKGEEIPQSYQVRLIDKEGSIKWVETYVVMIEWEGNPATLAFVNDITERNKAEEELRDSGEKYRLVVENSIEGIAVVCDGLICFTNPGVEKLLVYSKEELIDKPFIEFVHPEDREIIIERYQKRLKGEEIPQSYQVRLIDKEGSIKWVEVKVVMIEWEGNTATLAFVNDISERNKAEEELRESHNYLNNILNGMFAGMLVLDLNYEIVDVNSSFLEEYNTSREEVIGHKCYEITHQSNQPCDSSECVCPMRFIVETTSPTQVEHRHVSLEGEERFVEINFFPLFEADGEVGRVVEIIHDVTERVRAEEQVRIEAGRAKAMARIATSLNTHLDVEAVGKAICEEAAGALGVPLVSVCLYDSERDELVPAGQFGTPSTNMVDVQSIPCEFYCEPIQQPDAVVVFPNIQNTSEFPKLDLFTNLDIRTLVSAKIQRDEQFIGRMNILTIGEERTFTKDELILLQGLANQAAIALENARLYQSERDSHHKSEALRRAALVLTSTMAMDQVLEGILAELQKVVPFDNASVQLLEEDQLKLVTGRGFSNLADLTGTSFPARGRFRYSRVLETRKPFSKTIESPKIDQQNSHEEEQRSWLGVPLLIGDRIIGIITLNKLKPGFYTENHGQIAMAFAAAAANAIENARLFRDLEDKMLVLKETRNLLVQNEKLAAIGELVSGIAHELNNPISATLLLAQDSLQEESNQEIKNNLDKIVSESRRTAKIVRDLLAFSKQRSPDLDLIQINDVLVYTLDLLAYEIGKNNIKVTTELSKDMSPVLVDPLQIQQVVINIVNNACQAMAADPENAYLRITTETGPSIFLPESGTPQVVRIMFQDSGPGIHSYVLPRVFDPFFTSKPLGKGTGLGLSICHGIVNEHRGHIWVESELGQGATFFVELPVASMDEPRPTITKEQPPQLLSPSKYRILIIDDEESLLEILSRVLRRRGYQVVSVNNGEEGLDHAIKTNPDLIVCDLLMPGMSGQDIYFYLKSHAAELLKHVLFTTGDTLSPETRQFLEETDVTVLRKPFELDHFIDVVEEAIMGTD